MSRIRIVKGKITEIVHGDLRYYSAADIVENAGETYTEQSATGILHGGNPEKPPTAEKTRVKSIECITELDDGSANDGSGTNIQKGVLYEKSYSFKVKEYTDGEPMSPNSIHWAIKYTDPETEQEYPNILQNKNYRGTELKVNFTENECCGRNMEVQVYIENAENEGKLPIFMHNRFRWFDGEIIRNEVEARKLEPWLIYQDDTSTCGPSAIMYVFAKKYKDDYSKFILNLHRKGVAEYNNYTINIGSDSDLEAIAETNPNETKDYPKNIASADWIPNTCITDQENTFFDFEGKKNEDVSAITLPSTMVKLSKRLLGFKDVIDNTNVLFNKTGWAWGSTMEDIAELIQTKKEGYEVFLLIGVNMLYDKITDAIFAVPEHWVVLESINYSQTDPAGYIDLKLYTWGRDPEKKVYKYNSMRYEVFRTNYYGYIKAK